ncbi:hypothetical protein OPQ81_002336 [Rhizoctonia solani]|nr:hypothetical protein OPQ81_002336 [Rhizoctonia solani]
MYLATFLSQMLVSLRAPHFLLFSLHFRVYIDDFTILATSASRARNIQLLEDAAEDASSCLQALGLDFELDKCELIHFAKHGQSLQENPPLKLTRPSGESHTVFATSNTIRWLGFFLDRRLDFKYHVKKCAIKGLSVIAGLKLLANSVRGLSVAHARRLFKACVLPILTYGSAIWFTGTRQNSLIEPLVKAQNAGLRWLLGAFRTAPVSALEHLASIPPIHIALARISRNASARISTLPPGSEVCQRLPRGWDTHNPNLPHYPRPKPSARTSPIVHLADLSHPNCETVTPYLTAPWEHPHPWGPRLKVYIPPRTSSRSARKELAKKLRRQIAALATDGSIIGFTDGSKRVSNGCRKVGLGFTIHHQGVEIDYNCANLGPRFEVFDAEMLALALALKKATSHARRLEAHSIVLFADNQAAVSSITLLTKHPGQYASIAFREAADKFLEESPLNHIKVCWVPGHDGVEGNERADRLANEGGDNPPTPFLNRSLTWSKAQSTHHASRAWITEWTSHSHSRFVTNHLRRLPSLALSRFAKNFRGHRSVHTRLNQVILGHGFFGEYRERFRPDDDPSCPCGQPRQTLDHVIRDCPLHSDARRALRKVSGPMLDSAIFGTQAGLTALAQFLSASNAFTLYS